MSERFMQKVIFQSTPSAGRATPLAQAQKLSGLVFQSTPSAGRATPGSKPSLMEGHISIHALRREGDLDEYADIKPEL